MIAREPIAGAHVPGGEDLLLYRHDRDFIIMSGREELMGTRMRHSEEQLALETLKRLDAPAPHLLIGGYGMGFTLRAALAGMSATGRITEGELVPEIIEWAGGPMAELADGCLDDPRVTLRMGDVGDAIAEAKARYDAILLDVDNGPDGLVRAENDRLYTPGGLIVARRALKPGGLLAIWSAAPDPGFTRRLKKSGYTVEEATVFARPNRKGPRHTIWFAR
jgi:spermidine synthase